jgi:membrane protein
MARRQARERGLQGALSPMWARGARMFRDVTAKQFIKELARETGEDDISNGAAALAYYLTLAIFPAMIFLMAMIPYLPIQHVDQAIMDLLHQALPASAADMFSGVVTQITHEQRGGLLSFGFLGALWATSTGMYAIMQQLNITYDVDEARSFVRARLTAIGLSLLFAVLVLGGFSLIVLGGQIQDWLGSRFGFSEALLSFFVVFRWVIIVLGLLLAFALIYYLAPNVEQRFAFITPGSIVGVVLLMLASLAFAWYAKSFGNYDATYGSIGAVIVLMLWLYLAGISILIGSEINALVEHRSAEGKEKGEHAPGEADRNPAARQRARESNPQAPSNAEPGRTRAEQAGTRSAGQARPPTGPARERPFWTQSIGGLFGTMLTLAVVAALTGGRRPAAASQRDVRLR